MKTLRKLECGSNKIKDAQRQPLIGFIPLLNLIEDDIWLYTTSNGRWLSMVAVLKWTKHGLVEKLSVDLFSPAIDNTSMFEVSKTNV